MTQVPRELQEAAETNVQVVNVGDQHVIGEFNGFRLSFPPQSYDSVSSERCWLWFGDPSLRDITKEWNREVRRLEHRWGPSTWPYIEAGNLCVMDWLEKYGRGKDFYYPKRADVVPDRRAKPLTPEMQALLEAGMGVSKEGRTAKPLLPGLFGLTKVDTGIPLAAQPAMREEESEPPMLAAVGAVAVDIQKSATEEAEMMAFQKAQFAKKRNSG